MKHIAIRITIGLIALLMLAGCGAIAELVLDATWELEEIRAGDLITTNLDNYLTVAFNAETDEATLTVGPDWSSLSNVEVAGTFDFTINGTENIITLSQSGADRYVITYKLEGLGLDRMVWLSWVAVDLDPALEIVGDSAMIDYIAFSRQTSS